MALVILELESSHQAVKTHQACVSSSISDIQYLQRDEGHSLECVLTSYSVMLYIHTSFGTAKANDINVSHQKCPEIVLGKT